MKNYNYLFFFIAISFLFSCINNEGPGGTSVIQGYVYKVIHADDVFNLETDTVPASKEDVYMIFGDDSFYGDKTETSYNGFYQFKYLTKGRYKVFSYSTFDKNTKVAVIDSVSIDKDETKQLTDIYIHEGKALDKSYVKGEVQVKYYNKTNQVTTLLPAYEIRVYIQKVGAPYHLDETRVGLEGVFVFQNLDVGEYEVFVYTEDITTEALSPVKKTVSITEKGTIVEIPEIFEIIVHV